MPSSDPLVLLIPGCAALTRATGRSVTAGTAARYAAAMLLHSRCAQWMEKPVDNRLRALRHKGFKIVAKL